MLAICRLSVPLAASIFRASIAVAQTMTVGAVTMTVGAVDKVQAQVEAMQAGQTRALSNRKSISGIDATVQKARAYRRP